MRRQHRGDALLDPAAIDSWFRETTAADPWAPDPLPHTVDRDVRAQVDVSLAAVAGVGVADRQPPVGLSSEAGAEAAGL
ncbi:hypothetical protein GCM10009730_51260 [Streptomyces albidochromogenes]